MVALARDDVGRAARDAGVYVYSRLGASLLQVAGFVVAARLYPPSGLALVVYTLMVLQAAISLGSLGIPESVFYFFGRRGDPGVVVRQTTFLLVVLLPPVLGVVAAFGMVSGSAIDLRPSLGWLMLAVATELPAQPAVNLLLATGRAGLASLAYLSFTAMQMVAVVAPAILGLDARLVLPLLAAASGFRVVVYVWIVASHFPRTAPWLDRQRLREILAFSVPAGLAVISGTLNAQVDKYVVAFMLGVQDVADYAVGSWELPLVTLVPYAVGAVLQPRYVRLYAAGQLAELLDLWRGAIRKTSLLVVPLAMLLIVVADRLVGLVFPPEYARAALLFRLFSLILLTRVAYYGALLRATGDTRALLVAALFVFGTNLALTVPFTLLFGFPGAALATVVASVLGMGFVVRLIARRLGVGLAPAVPWRHHAATIGIAAAVAVPSWLALRFSPLGPLPSVAMVAPLFLAGCYALGRAARLVGPEDGAYLRRWLTLGLLKEKS